MKDNFSKQAAAYAKFRPDYPDEMIDWLLQFVAQRGTALDVATGNGQAARKLARHFERVFAIDINEKQIALAKPQTNVTYRVGSGENTGFSDKTFDLIVVAQAVHWFDFGKFYAEVRRILKPDGIFAVLGYGPFQTNAGSDKILKRYYRDIVGPYWDAERRYVDQMYQTIPFPFDEINSPGFTNRFTWTFSHLTGYLQSWSATQHFIARNGFDPVNAIRGELESSWENSNKEVVFPLLLRAGKLKSNV